MYARLLDLRSLVDKKSHFLLFGPRGTGKSWLIRHQLPKAQIFDLLDDDVYTRLLRRPRRLGDEIESDLVVIDEVQKAPRLLDEVHRLIETKRTRFLLTGSSARKLKRGGANLLAGRARSRSLFPLTMAELSDFDLVKYLNRGGLPAIYTSDDYLVDLKDYVNLYLKEEVQAEALVRRVDHFARFLDVVGAASGQELNIEAIGRDAAVPPRTVANYIEVLKDTLLAFELPPFSKTKKRKVSSKSKIYLFDVGVANFMAGRHIVSEHGESFGAAFEHFILQEVRARLSYAGIDWPMQYWRTQRGEFEVDCVLGQEMAIEIKATSSVHARDLKGLIALRSEGHIKQYFLVSRDPVQRTVDGIDVMPWTMFLSSALSQKSNHVRPA